VNPQERVGGDMPPTLAAALTYSSLGWHVFPVKQDKTPRTLKGFHAATTDEEQIRQWWDMWRNADLAVRTGQESGLVVIDADGDEGEQTAIDRGLFDVRTPTVLTAKGIHWYFAWPGYSVQSKVRILPGLDVRGDGGYVVLPPSIHESGTRYAWHDTYPTVTPLAPMPEWVVQRRDPPLTKGLPVGNGSQSRSVRYVETVFQSEVAAVRNAPEGTRNDQLNRSAFAVARFVRTGELTAVRYRDELTRAAIACGLKSVEIERTLRSALEGRGGLG
jgi:Bifunctional DNA primase/polymerase, N-terminal